MTMPICIAIVPGSMPTQRLRKSFSSNDRNGFIHAREPCGFATIGSESVVGGAAGRAGATRAGSTAGAPDRIA